MHRSQFTKNVDIYDRAAVRGHVQMGSDFNMLVTLLERVNWPLEIAIYGPSPDLWLLKFGLKILSKIMCQQGSIKWLLGSCGSWS